MKTSAKDHWIAGIAGLVIGAGMSSFGFLAIVDKISAQRDQALDGYVTALDTAKDFRHIADVAITNLEACVAKSEQHP